MTALRANANMSVSRETRIRANHISAATGRKIVDLADEAFRVLQERYGLPEPLALQGDYTKPVR